MLTRIAPIFAVAYWTNTHSATFGAQIPTRSPVRTPAPSSPSASASTCADELRVGPSAPGRHVDEGLAVGIGGRRCGRGCRRSCRRAAGRRRCRRRTTGGLGARRLLIRSVAQRTSCLRSRAGTTSDRPRSCPASCAFPHTSCATAHGAGGVTAPETRSRPGDSLERCTTPASCSTPPPTPCGGSPGAATRSTSPRSRSCSPRATPRSTAATRPARSPSGRPPRCGRRRPTSGPSLVERARELKTVVADAEAEARELDAQLQDLLLGIPNLPADDVPDGSSEDDAELIRTWGEAGGVRLHRPRPRRPRRARSGSSTCRARRSCRAPGSRCCAGGARSWSGRWPATSSTSPRSTATPSSRCRRWSTGRR